MFPGVTGVERGSTIVHAARWAGHARTASSVLRILFAEDRRPRWAQRIVDLESAGKAIQTLAMANWPQRDDQAITLLLGIAPDPITLDQDVVLGRVGGCPVLAGKNWRPGTFFSPYTADEILTQLRGSSYLVTARYRVVGVEAVEPPASRGVVEPRTQKIIEQLRRRSRSVVLYGPPGSGKTTAARQIAAAMGGHAVNLAASAVSEADAWRFVHAMRPTTLVIDDVDSAGGLDHALADLERARTYAGAIVATANTPDVLRSAARRPGRLGSIPAVYYAAPDVETAMAIAPTLTEAEAQHAVEVGLLADYLAEMQAAREDGEDVTVDDMRKRQEQVETGEFEESYG